MFRVGKNYIYIFGVLQHFWQGNYQIYDHIRCMHTVLANPSYGMITGLQTHGVLSFTPLPHPCSLQTHGVLYFTPLPHPCSLQTHGVPSFTLLPHPCSLQTHGVLSFYATPTPLQPANSWSFSFFATCTPLQPANVFLDADFDAKLGDIGDGPVSSLLFPPSCCELLPLCGCGGESQIKTAYNLIAFSAWSGVEHCKRGGALVGVKPWLRL